MKTNGYEKLKSEVLPEGILEHFNEAREVFEKNRKILESVGEPLRNGTIGENALLKIFAETTKRNEHSMNVIFKDMELAYVMTGVLKREIRRIKQTLHQQGITIDNLSNDEGLEWLNNYFKHTGETSLD